MRAGTDPNDSRNYLYVLSVTLSGLDAQITFSSIAGKNYRVERTDDVWPAVIRGLDSDNDRKRAIIERAVPKILHNSIRDFAALRGSKMYNAFLSGSLVYLSFVLQKS